MKRLLFLMSVLVAATAFVACSDDKDDPDYKVDPAFVKALSDRYPTAYSVDWDREGAWFVAEFNVDRDRMEAWFDSDARWAMTRTELNRNLLSVPTAVANAFASGDYSTWQIDDIDYYEKPQREFFVIEVENPGQADMDLFYNTDGTLIKAVPSTDADITPATVI